MISIKLSAAMNAQMLHVIAIWSGSTTAGATFKDSLSFSTEYSLHRRLARASSTLTGRAADYGCRSDLVNHRFTTLRSCSKLFSLLMRTLTYALGRSGRARRKAPGFLRTGTLYDP